jgi:hypothetical protein
LAGAQQAQVTIEHQIWNRAAVDSGGPEARKGDRALAGMLRAHGLVMNGGVWHAVELLPRDELDSAVMGYAFYGMSKVGALLERTRQLTEREQDEPLDTDGAATLDGEYWSLVPGDETLVDAFERHYRARPDLYAEPGVDHAR